MLGTSDRIGEELALRRRDVDDTVRPMQVTVPGNLVVIKGQSVYRQDHPMTSSSNRTLLVPEFTADVLRRRPALIERYALRLSRLLHAGGDSVLSHILRRTLRTMLADAGLADLKVTPHPFGEPSAQRLPDPLTRRPRQRIYVTASISPRSTTSSARTRRRSPSLFLLLQSLAPHVEISSGSED